MTLFGEALKIGMAAAEEASLARKEVDEVFRELDQQVMSASEGRLSIRRCLKTVDPSTWGSRSKAERLLEQIDDALTYPPKPREKYWAIVASNPAEADGVEREIAIWSQDRTGYPCFVFWAGRERICQDRESLENCLEDLLKHPDVGHTLARLMNAQPAEPTA